MLASELQPGNDLSGDQIAFLLSRGAGALIEVTIVERPEYLFDDGYVRALRRMVGDFLLGPRPSGR